MIIRIAPAMSGESGSVQPVAETGDNGFSAELEKKLTPATPTAAPKDNREPDATSRTKDEHKEAEGLPVAAPLQLPVAALPAGEVKEALLQVLSGQHTRPLRTADGALPATLASRLMLAAGDAVVTGETAPVHGLSSAVTLLPLSGQKTQHDTPFMAPGARKGGALSADHPARESTLRGAEHHEAADLTPHVGKVTDPAGNTNPVMTDHSSVLSGTGVQETAHHSLFSPSPVAPVDTVAVPRQVASDAASPAVVTTGTLPQDMGTPAWQQALGQQILCFSRDGVHHAELRLHPEELGALQINLKLNSDQAQLHFVTENHQVRAALESAMPHLRTSLAESGIQLGQSSVGGESASSQGSAQTDSQGDRHSPDGDAESAGLSAGGEAAPVIRHLSVYSSGINTFV